MTALIRIVRIEGAVAGPLAGETVAVKANIAVAGQVWDGASPALASVVADTHAGAVARVLAAGGTVVGQGNMHELAFGITSANAAFGPVESPHGGMAGGSSGGTAAAVAGGLATLGLGSDTGGSGRLPAAFCGCIGMRPSTGRYPADGVLLLSPSLDTVTPMARDVAALLRLDGALANDAAPVPRVSLDGIRLGRVADPFWSRLDPRVRAVVETAIERLCAAGATVEDRQAHGLAEAIDAVALPLVIAEARRWWTRFSRERLGIDLTDLPARIASPDVAGAFEEVVADRTDDAALAALQGAGMARVRDLLAEAMDGLDALIHPTVPVAAPPMGAESVEVEGTDHPLFPLLTGRALAASLAGAPAVTLPVPGFDQRPLGIEILGPPGADRALLGLAAAVEAALR